MNTQLEEDIEEVRQEAFGLGVTDTEFNLWERQMRSMLAHIGLTAEAVRRLANTYGRRV